MITGGFDLRYDLFDSFSQCLPWADGSRIFAATPWPYGAYRWVRLRAARFFEETTGPPAWCGRACSSCRVRMAHPLRSSAGTSTWRAGRRSLTFCQSCQGSAQQFSGRELSRYGRDSRAPPAQEEWGSPEGAKPPWRLFGDFLSVQKVTGVRGEEPRAFDEDGIYSEEKGRRPAGRHPFNLRYRRKPSAPSAVRRNGPECGSPWRSGPDGL